MKIPASKPYNNARERNEAWARVDSMINECNDYDELCFCEGTIMEAIEIIERDFEATSQYRMVNPADELRLKFEGKKAELAKMQEWQMPAIN